jgi:hypothetical protein
MEDVESDHSRIQNAGIFVMVAIMRHVSIEYRKRKQIIVRKLRMSSAFDTNSALEIGSDPEAGRSRAFGEVVSRPGLEPGTR